MSCYLPNPEVYFQVKANSLGKPLGRRSDLLGRGTRLYSQSPSSLLVIWKLGVSVQSGSLIIRSQNTCRYKPQFLKLTLPLINVNRMAEYCCTSYALHNFRDAICVLVIAASWWFWPSLCSNHLTYFTFVSEIRVLFTGILQSSTFASQVSSFLILYIGLFSTKCLWIL